MVHDGKAYQYATWCVNETDGKVPKYVKKQARDWINIADGNDPDAYVDEEAYEKICRLLKIMVHPDLRCSIFDGLEDYAWLFITATLCTKLRNSEFESRFYVTALLEIARKNFKTFTSAVIFIILMLTEPDFSRFFSVAPDLSLSSELQKAIRKIIKVSPALYDEDESAFKLLRSQIICTLNENEYTPLAYSKDGMDGKLANTFLADEAGALDEYPVEAMRSSQITLFNKLGIIISTQYPNDNNVLIDEIDLAKKTLDGLTDDRRYFSLLYEPDQELQTGDTWKTDDRVIYQSNPVAVAHEYIFKEIKKKRTLAVLYENKRENYLCKHSNILYKGLGKATERDEKIFIKYEINNVLKALETAINRAMLLESEKGQYYFEADTDDLNRSDIEKRYAAYGTGIEKGFLQVDEVRKKEKMPQLGVEFIKLGLNDGLLDPVANKVYVLNTNKTIDLNKLRKGEEVGELNLENNPSSLTDTSMQSGETAGQSGTEEPEKNL